MAYVDGFVVPVPKNKLEAYREMAKKAGAIWREYGALEYRECIADDVKPGKVTSFPQSVMLKPDETVVFSWILYKSRAHRDEVNAKVMGDPRMSRAGRRFPQTFEWVAINEKEPVADRMGVAQNSVALESRRIAVDRCSTRSCASRRPAVGFNGAAWPCRGTTCRM